MAATWLWRNPKESSPERRGWRRDVIGDTIVVLNPNLQVVWAWDAFDHLDNTRKASPRRDLLRSPTLAAHPGVFGPHRERLAARECARTHSGRKKTLFDAQSGLGDQSSTTRTDQEMAAYCGISRMRATSPSFPSDPSPWFSPPSTTPISNPTTYRSRSSTMAIRRQASQPGKLASRGQLLTIDEWPDGDSQLSNADVGTYSSAVGSAQALPNGNYHFDSGLHSGR